MRDMSAPAHESKRNGSVRKATALGAPHAKKKRRLNAPDDRGGEGETHSQPPAIPKRARRLQKQAPRGRGQHEARQATIPVVQEVTCGEHGLGRGSKDDDPEFGQEMEFG